MVKVQRLFAETNLKVRVCGAKRNNESPSGAFKRPNGLAQQDGGALPRQVRVCGAKRNNESPSGAFKRQNGLALARWRGLAPTSSRLRSEVEQ